MKSRLMITCCVGLLLVLTFIPAVTHSDVPKQINYQGFLTDPDGDPVPDDDYSMTFKIYDVSTEGISLWSETQIVTVINGKYTAILGKNNPIDPEDLDGDRYFGITVAPDEEMTPRLKLTSTAFSIKAGDAYKLGGMDSSQYALITEMCDWSEITGIPSGFADGTDDTGITTETDPTVPASVKDGTSWSELSEIPSGFADGTDDTGITTETDPTVPASVKDGISWSELSEIPSGFADGVDDTGVTIPFELSGSSSTAIISGLNGDSGPGVYGKHHNSGNYGFLGGQWVGVHGEGFGDHSVGVFGVSHGSIDGVGVKGGAIEEEGVGVYGWNQSSNTEGRLGCPSVGVQGDVYNAEEIAVSGEHHNSGNHGFLGGQWVGVHGEGFSDHSVGVFGVSHGSIDGVGVKGGAMEEEGVGVYGWNQSSNTEGRLGCPSVGVQGDVYNAEEIGVHGTFHGSGYENMGTLGHEYFGVEGYTSKTDGAAVFGKHLQSGNNGYIGQPLFGVYGEHSATGNVGFLGSGDYGVHGRHQQSGNWGNIGNEFFGVYGAHGATGNSGFLGNEDCGVRGNCYGSGTKFGVFGIHEPTENWGALGTEDHAGEFAGDVVIWGNQTTHLNLTVGGNLTTHLNLTVDGNLTTQGNLTVHGYISKGSGSFIIDHPLDPKNKYLYHSFVESPDMMNVYNGNAILNADGEAWVNLPEWFEALNKEFRYQLTPVGAPGPNLYIAEEISENSFRIAGGTPGLKVSWQVTGIRQDPYANAHRIVVEVDKPPEHQGHYLHPDVYGEPEKKM